MFPPSLSEWAAFQETQACPQVPMIGRKNGIPIVIPGARKKCFVGEQEGLHIKRWLVLL